MLRTASYKDIPALRNLFKVCFGDSDVFLDLFFNNYFVTTTSMVAICDKQIAAMLFLCPASMKYQGATKKIFYVYACATLPQYRNKGMMQELLESAFNYAKDTNVWGLVLAPANEHLCEYYSRLGFIPFSGCRHITITKSDRIGSLGMPGTCKLTAEEIAKIRLEKFSENLQIQWNSNHIQFSADMFELEGGGQIGIEWENGEQDYVMYSNMNKSLIIKETSTDPNRYNRLMDFLFKEFEPTTIDYSAPNSEGELFSMIKPIGEYRPDAYANPYLGLEMA